MDRKERLVLADTTGGRNGVDPPTSPRFRANQVTDAVNVDWYQSSFGRKRNGSSAAGVTFGSGGPFTGKISTLVRHVPSTDPTAAEVWAIDDASTPIVGRKAGATTFTAPTLKDALTGNGWDVSAASLNGKLFLAYKSGQNRLHCWDGSTVRRAGLPTPATPTAANSGTGSYAAVQRYYRVRWIEEAGGVVVRRSEPSDSVAFTPNGSSAQVNVTRPTAAGEGETHWELEASVDNATFYVVYGINGITSPVAIATTVAGDAVAVTGYSAGAVSATTGTYTLQKPYKFLAADQNRLLGFSSYTSTDKQNRIEISGVVGSLDIGDAERVDTTLNYFVDLDENDSGVPMGLMGPVFGNFYAFKDRQVWELAATGSTAQPYAQRALSKEIGLVSPRAVARGDDALGNAALYWLSHRGFYRYGALGLEYIGEGVEDLVLGPTSTINLGAAHVVAHLQYHADKWQLWAWFATGTSDDPDTLVIYDVKKGGWSRFTGTAVAQARCSAMLPATIAASMSRALVPYIGPSGTSNAITKLDDASATDDSGTAFQAYLDLRPLEPGGAGFVGEVGDAVLLAKTASAVTITVRVTPDFDTTLAKTGTALLTAIGSETRVSRRVEDSRLTETSFVQYRVGDASATSNAWSLDRLTVPYNQQQAVSA